mmetsp:Transcript_19926/g.28034  ORF Transcript_19926/g.28034 Transcript_19926/m.28034 type:complete len:203 (+) Transcript_19926:488-1096(+)
MDRFMKMTCLDFQTWMTGMPAMPLLGSSSAALLTVSFAPITIATSISSISSLISSISCTMSYGTPASASSTLSWPGMRPATGCTANFTVLPLSVRCLAMSATDFCAWATASPYPGTMHTLWASWSAWTVPATSISVCTRPSAVCTAPDSVPKPPRMTLVRERFIPSHMILVRKAPLEPISAPTMVRRGWFKMNPSAHRAHPE